MPGGWGGARERRKKGEGGKGRNSGSTRGGPGKPKLTETTFCRGGDRQTTTGFGGTGTPVFLVPISRGDPRVRSNGAWDPEGPGPPMDPGLFRRPPRRRGGRPRKNYFSAPPCALGGADGEGGKKGPLGSMTCRAGKKFGTINQEGKPTAGRSGKGAGPQSRAQAQAAQMSACGPDEGGGAGSLCGQSGAPAGRGAGNGFRQGPLGGGLVVPNQGRLFSYITLFGRQNRRAGAFGFGAVGPLGEISVGAF